jgi:hypothetical protein
MSFREWSMIDVREVLRHWQAGQSVRAIGRESGTERKTVVRHVGAAEGCGLDKQRAHRSLVHADRRGRLRGARCGVGLLRRHRSSGRARQRDEHGRPRRRADELLRLLRQSRMDNSRDAMTALTTIDLFILTTSRSSP